MNDVKQGRGQKEPASKAKFPPPRPKPLQPIVIKEGAKYDPSKH